MASKRRIRVTVNGTFHEHEIEPRLLLVDYLRNVLGLTGTHFGCDTTSCGACTVMIDGRSAKSCTFLAVQADARDVLTIEGISRDGTMHPVQVAFSEQHALQCGFCSSGMVMSAYALLSKNPDPSEGEIRRAIAGNLCRCTGYVPIVEALKSAAQKIRANTQAK